MRRVVNYHSSWARQRQVELFDASGNPGFTAGRGYNPAGGAPGGARDLTKTLVRISYATQPLPEQLTPKLFSPEIARDKNQRNTQLCSSTQNRSSQNNFNFKVKTQERSKKGYVSDKLKESKEKI
ncbi:hypothetical protein F511_38467 [Dorcoceras hygrometricum]|uniref:Uncharacterized protein n=1 Tax=Dorcoceras hygrometricum TaxID=472368 RepID=A0A2Z7AP08_9LAMI|nr:hypothetical protein F511_38467 [Dorcoceras hygrometricum]